MRGYTVALVICKMVFLNSSVISQKYIADYRVAKEEVLRSIPEEYINQARSDLVISLSTYFPWNSCFSGVSDYQIIRTEMTVLFGISNP